VKFGTAMHIRPSNLLVDQKYKKNQNPRWQTAVILKIKNRDIYKTVYPILMKFCTMAHFSSPELTSCSKNSIFKNPNWQTAIILTIVKCDISASI